jgi:hypothetical protein
METEIILKIWPVLLVIFCVIIWAVRLEAKTMGCKDSQIRFDVELIALKSKIETEHTKFDGKFEAFALALSGIKESLARIETVLSMQKEK